MRIVLVTNYYENHKGGIELVAGRLAEQLSSLHDARITWLASDFDNYKPVIGKFYKTDPIKSYDFLSRFLPFDLPVISLSAMKKLKYHIKDCNLVHIHEYLSFINLFAINYAIKYKKPILITQHVGIIQYKNPFQRKLFSFLNKSLGKKVLRKADGRVFVSEKVMDYFESECGVMKANDLIPNGVDHNIFNPKNKEWIDKKREELGYKPQEIIFMFAGKFEAKKGLSIIEYLAKNMPEVKWILAGFGNIDPNKWNLRNVKVANNLDSKDLANLYRISDLFVLPSYGEGFPLVVQESMACGTPVLISKDTLKGFKKLEKHCFSVAILDEDAKEKWLDKCKILADKSDKLINLREDSAKFAQREWNWIKTTKKYHDLMINLIRYY